MLGVNMRLAAAAVLGLLSLAVMIGMALALPAGTRLAFHLAGWSGVWPLVWIVVMAFLAGVGASLAVVLVLAERGLERSKAASLSVGMEFNLTRSPAVLAILLNLLVFVGMIVLASLNRGVGLFALPATLVGLVLLGLALATGLPAIFSLQQGRGLSIETHWGGLGGGLGGLRISSATVQLVLCLLFLLGAAAVLSPVADALRAAETPAASAAKP